MHSDYRDLTIRLNPVKTVSGVRRICLIRLCQVNPLFASNMIIQVEYVFHWLPFDDIPKQFDTEDLAKAAGISRSDAQRITYCLRETGAIRPKGKRGRSNLYQRPVRRIKKKARVNKKRIA